MNRKPPTYGPSPLLGNATKNAIIARHLQAAQGRHALAKAMTDPLRIDIFYGCPDCGWSTITQLAVRMCPVCCSRVEFFKPPPEGIPPVWGEEKLGTGNASTV